MDQTCGNCFNVFADDALFCRKCGTKRSSTRSPVMPAMPSPILPRSSFDQFDFNHDGVITRSEFNNATQVFAGSDMCAACGNVFADDAVFCRKCGTRRFVDAINGAHEFDLHLACTILQWFLTFLLLYLAAGLDPLGWGKEIVGNLQSAFTTLPSGPISPWALHALGLSLVFSSFVGVGSGVMACLRRDLAPVTSSYFMLTTLGALVEEAWFRAALLPPDATGTEAVIAWIIWCLYHQDLIHYYFTASDPDGRSVFRNPHLLLLAASTGLACIAVFIGTGGCWIASATVHVLFLWVGLFAFGSEQYLSGKEE